MGIGQSVTLALICAVILSACHSQTHSSSAPVPSQANPVNWPLQPSPIPRDPATEQKIAELLAQMTLEEKVGQVIQADIASITPQEAAKYNLGSILNGGNSAPFGDNRTAPANWLNLADEFYRASIDKSDGGLGIPILWGIDAVHGHNNIVGATIFPHNIGLGAANDPMLMKRIGEVTAKEILVTGIDWTFAPTLAVVRNDRWGRTYESYSEAPEIVASYAKPLIEGIQGQVNSEEFLGEQHILATAKHFLGDGGTENGKDQGDTRVSETVLRDIHGAGYPPAIEAGAQVVMASFNSWYGRKMHGDKTMLTDVLVKRMGFDGFVVGDWNGHGQVQGCTNISCPQSFNAGLDMFMAPDSWKALYYNTLAQVKDGRISMARLEQAVSRILRVKIRTGLFEAGLPSSRPLAGKFDLLGAPAHRAVAREAVRKSLVLLKNNDGLLPLSPEKHVLVVGAAADDIGQQSGGWTLSWQGTGNKNSDFPNGESIYQGIRQAVEAAGGSASLSVDGAYTQKPDVAIVVFGEQPYAEFQGDRAHVDFAADEGLTLLTWLKAQGIPTVSVFLSGRPMWVNPELNQSDAFVAAWLPGSEGGGVADMLFSDPDGNLHRDFTGRLSFSWPALPGQAELNLGDANYAPLFAYGYGLSLKDAVNVPRLNEETDVELTLGHKGRYLFAGDPVAPWRLVLSDEAGNAQVTGSAQNSPSGALQVEAADYQAQEDSMVATWHHRGRLSVTGNPIDLSAEFQANQALQLELQVLEAGMEQAWLSLQCGDECETRLEVTKGLKSSAGKGWRILHLPLSCFATGEVAKNRITSPLSLLSTSGLKIQIRSAGLVDAVATAGCQLSD